MWDCGPDKLLSSFHFLLIDQRKLLLWLQIRRSDNAVLQTMSMLNRSEFTALCSKYSCDVVMSPGKVKNMIWNKFASSVFLPRDASAERGDATVSRLSVRPSVCDV